MAKIAIVQGHPDPAEERLNRALAQRYAEGALAAGHEVRRIDVARLDFPTLRTGEEFYAGTPSEAIAQAQRDIAWADHVAFFFPLWMGDVPALFKAFVEQTFRPGFAMTAHGGKMPRGLLRGRSARIVVTMGMPAVIYRTAFGAHAVRAYVKNLQLCGFSPVTFTLVGGVAGASARRCKRWLTRIERLGRRDAGRGAGALAVALRWSMVGGAAAAGLYAIAAGAAWLQFGKGRRSDSLLDALMPEYDVRLHHQIHVHATPEKIFEALHHTQFDRSPIVAALVRAREVLLRAKSAESVERAGLPATLATLGWSAIGDEPGREIIFGAVTQPWRPNPEFRGLPRDEFASFCEPGYAKIALTMRVDPLGDGTSLAQTETRVATTDAESRSRLRRYWSLVAPGIELIRIVLLAQLKSEAELAKTARAGRP